MSDVKERHPSMQHYVFENQDVMQFPCVGQYGIPQISPTDTVGEKFLRFMDWKTMTPKTISRIFTTTITNSSRHGVSRKSTSNGYANSRRLSRLTSPFIRTSPARCRYCHVIAVNGARHGGNTTALT